MKILLRLVGLVTLITACTVQAANNDRADSRTDKSADKSSTANCTTHVARPGETVSIVIAHGGENRVFAVHLPAGYDCSKALPMVIGVHGYTGSGPDFQANTAQMTAHVDANNYIAIFPTGLAASTSGPTAFNDLGSRHDNGPDGKTCNNKTTPYENFKNCGLKETERECQWGTSCADDVGFFQAMIDYAKVNYAVDGTRIYMMGFSQGGQTVASLACALQHELAAVVPVHGFAANGYSCGPDGKVSLFQIWGTKDPWVRADGGASDDGMQYDGADEAAAEWAAVQGCDAVPTAYQTRADGIQSWACSSHANCSTGAELVSCSWAGGHTWPVSTQAGNFGLNAIWDFVSTQQK